MEGFIGFIILSVVTAVYLIPTFVAANVKHHNAAAIFVLNLFLGWTLVGWVLALVWSLTKPAPTT